MRVLDRAARTVDQVESGVGLSEMECGGVGVMRTRHRGETPSLRERLAQTQSISEFDRP